MPLSSSFPLGPRRTGRPAPAALAEMRAATASAPSPYLRAPGVATVDRELGDVRCVVATPEGGFSGEMIYFHGGGYRLGGPDRMAGFLTQIAARAGCRVIAPAYALAPEEPYPAALHDAASIIGAVVADGPASPLLLAGDSAGGGLAAACCVGFGRALPSVRGAILLSPWLDLRISARTFDRCAATDQLFSRQAAMDAAEAYLQGESADAPLASPLLAPSLEDVPPTLIIAGSAEVLLQDSVDFAARLAAHHIGVELIVVPKMQHVSPAIFPDLPSSALSLDAITRFARARLDGAGLTADPRPQP